MKTITINQLTFATLIAILTLAFRFGLSNLLDQRDFLLVWVLAAVYAVLMFISGYVIGKKDHESFPYADIGFKFHLITYVVFVLVSEIWYLLEYNSVYEYIKTVHHTAIFWGIGLLVHYIFFRRTRRNAIKGIDKSEIFD